MAAIIDKYIINNEKYDRRVKLTKEDKKEIYEVYKEGLFSQRELATLFDVSRRSISFIVSPEQLKANKKCRAERGGWKQYYNKEANTLEANNHREYKKLLLKSGVNLTKVCK